MTASEPGTPRDRSPQDDLAAALDGVLRLLGRAGDRGAGDAPAGLDDPAPGSALARIRDAFALDAFETGILLLGAACELVPGIGARLADLNGAADRPWPTFGLALAVLPGARWSALVPTAPLRAHRLLRLGPGAVLTERPIHLEERILHALLGETYLDPALQAVLAPLPSTATLPGEHRTVAGELRATWGGGPVHLWCERPADGLAIAAAAADAAVALRLPASAMPLDPVQIDELVALWNREQRLQPLALAVDLDDADDRPAQHAALEVARRAEGAVVTCGRDPRAGEALLRLRVSQAPFEDRLEQWQEALGELGGTMDGRLDELVARFRLDAAGLDAAVAGVHRGLARAPQADTGRLLWRSARLQALPHLEDLAQRMPVRAGWSALVLPEPQLAALRAIRGQCRRKALVDHRWGFTPDGARGGGTSAVFSGPSGTGKTLAAEVLAGDLDLDLYRIDLSAVVSKYIGETEKNLRRVFDAAEAGGAVLLFDEADALFGKRTEVRDSHDRHANIEVSYLLQRMESYSGLAILTTNHRQHLDDAFLRRIPYLVEFPFPDAELREAIWRGVFPPGTPLADIDYPALARLSISGGSIRGIARTAAFLAADGGGAVTMADLRRGTELEYDKLGRSLTPGEVRGWPATTSPSTSTNST